MNNPIIRLIIVHARENNDRRASNLIRIPSRRLNTFTLQIFLRLQKFMKIQPYKARAPISNILNNQKAIRAASPLLLNLHVVIRLCFPSAQCSAHNDCFIE